MFITRVVMSLAILSGACAFAKDIVPEEKLGKIQVDAPDISKLDPKFELSSYGMSFKVEDKTTNLKLGKESLVTAGEGCLTVQYSNYYQASQCGIKIANKKLTKIKLAALKLSWNPQQVQADVGPQPSLYFSTTDAQYTLQANVNPAENEVFQVLLVPPMTVVMTLSHENTGDIYQQVKSLSAGDTKEETFKVPDLRGSIQVEFIDGAPAFTDDVEANNSISVVYRLKDVGPGYSNAPTDLNSKPIGRNEGSDGGYGEPVSFFKFKATGESKTVRAFPLAAGKGYYDIVVNEVVVRTEVKAKQSVRVPIATLNLHNYASSLPGTFKIFVDYTDQENFEPYLVPRNYGTPARLEEAKPFPTERSFFFPILHRLRFDFYIKDSLGKETLQDQQEVDLSHEGNNLFKA